MSRLFGVVSCFTLRALVLPVFVVGACCSSVCGVISRLRPKVFGSFVSFAAQSTPPSTHRIKTIRRQSSIGAYHDNGHVAPPIHAQFQQQPAPVQQQPQQQSSVPISSSTSYYTNSPSPPHQGGDNNLQPSQDLSQRLERTLEHTTANHRPMTAAPLPDTFLDTTNLAQFIPHSNIDIHSDLLVLSRNQFEAITSKLDQLSRRVQSLEHNLHNDVRLILNLLQAQQGNKENGVKTEVSISVIIIF